MSNITSKFKKEYKCSKTTLTSRSHSGRSVDSSSVITSDKGGGYAFGSVSFVCEGVSNTTAQTPLYRFLALAYSSLFLNIGKCDYLKILSSDLRQTCLQYRGLRHIQNV